MRLGIDFGTTRTVVAAVDDGRHPIAAFNDGGEFRDYIPGIAALRGGELIVGWEARVAAAIVNRPRVESILPASLSTGTTRPREVA